MKKRILCAILSLAAVFSLIGFNATEAWFSDGKNKKMILKSGNMDYVADGNISLKETNPEILPGKELELAEAIVITNNSSIDTELRIVVECKYEGSETNVQWKNEWIEFVLDGNEAWEQDEDDGFMYYRPNGNSVIPGVEISETSETTTETIIETTTSEAEAVSDEGDSSETTTEETTTRVYASNEIPFAGKIKISEDVPPDFINKSVKFSFTIQAKQAEIMEWSDFAPVSGEVTPENPEG